MGMFTEIQDPISGEYVQIKVGDDFCNRYQLGDTLEEDCESDHIERAMSSDGLTHLVVIKDKKVIFVGRVLEKDDKDTEKLDLAQIVLGSTFNINQDTYFYPRLVKYTDKLNENYRKQFRPPLWKRIKNWFMWRFMRDRAIKNLAKSVSNPIIEQINYEGIARQIFKAVPVDKTEEN